MGAKDLRGMLCFAVKWSVVMYVASQVVQANALMPGVTWWVFVNARARVRARACKTRN